MKEALNILPIRSNAVGPILDDRDVRDHLRRDLHRCLEDINQKLSEGKHITSLSYTVFTEGQGFDIMVEFDQDVTEPGKHPHPLEGLE
jgi:hypothetical protein